MKPQAKKTFWLVGGIVVGLAVAKLALGVIYLDHKDQIATDKAKKCPPTYAVNIETGECIAPDTNQQGAAPSQEKPLPWADVAALLATGQVQGIMQSHDLTVKIITHDGNRFTTTQPKIDAIMALVQACQTCQSQNIIVGSE